jgi:class 3 adenylate cyclase
MSAPSGRGERRLAAILMLDVANFSAMMGRDDRSTTARVVEFHRWVRDLVESHDGRVVKTAGDSVFGEFDSIVEAVECAMAIQRRLAAEPTEGDRLMARIGIHVGDVIVHDDDLFGDGVNIAARLEPLAEPGGLAVSEAVFLEVGTRLELPFEDAGMHSLKNIERRVRVYRVGADAFGYPLGHRPADPVPESPPASNDLGAILRGIGVDTDGIGGMVAGAIEEHLREQRREVRREPKPGSPVPVEGPGAATLREGLDRIPVPTVAKRMTSVRFLVNAAVGLVLLSARTTGWTTNGLYPMLGCVFLGFAAGGLAASVTRRRGASAILVAVGFGVGALFLSSAVARAVLWVLAAALLGTGLQRMGTRV